MIDRKKIETWVWLIVIVVCLGLFLYMAAKLGPDAFGVWR